MSEGGGGRDGGEKRTRRLGSGEIAPTHTRAHTHVRTHAQRLLQMLRVQTGERKKREELPVFLSGCVSVYVWQHEKNKNQGQAVANLSLTAPQAAVNTGAQHLKFYLARHPIRGASEMSNMSSFIVSVQETVAVNTIGTPGL